MDELFHSQQAFFNSGVTRSFQFRYGQLTALYKAIKRFEPELIRSLKKDLGKNEFESFSSEIGQVYKEISYTKRNLKSWMAPRKVGTPLIYFPSSSLVIADPRGVSLLIGPWNYPFLLIMKAMINSMAAGNTVILKPSEISEATAEVIRRIVEETFEQEYIAVVLLDGPLLQKELIQKYPINIIHFTGSTRVGKLVMEAAASQLTPVVLELGGKSPAIIAEDAQIGFAARKIIFSKMMNAGQTCVAPDYLLVHEKVMPRMLEAIKMELGKMYGDDPQKSPDIGRIINASNFDRLTSYFAQGDIVHGGRSDAVDRFIELTILENVDMDAPVMREEIFGPVLPVLAYRTNEEALELIGRNPFPLSLYVYTKSRKTEKFFIDNVRFGGGCVNNGLLHLTNSKLPFGGVMTSGMGNYHGRYGFETFSHQKGIVKTPTWIDFPLYYAPVKEMYLKMVRWFLK